jgi:hypothetical protein
LSRWIGAQLAFTQPVRIRVEVPEQRGAGHVAAAVSAT